MDKFSLNKIIRVVSIVFFIFLLSQNLIYSQEKYSVFGKVKIENGTIDNTYITILKNAEKMETKMVENSGKFEYSLEFGHEYILEFSQEGFVTKKVSISTFVPVDVLSRDSQFPPFKFMVSLFPAYEGLDLSVFDQPMGMIMYDKELDDFAHDSDYDAQIRDAIKRAEEEAKRRAAELEAERLAKERAYAAAIQRGDINFKARKYDLSKVVYTEALTIKEEEEYPKSQLLKIEELLNQDIANAAEQARLAAEKKALEEKYIAIIAQADTQFETNTYDLSKTSYTEALLLKPKEAYPKNQIQKINDLVADQEKLAAEQKALEDKYASIIALADSQFSSGDYQSSKTSYSDALELKADETYPKSQIQKIDEILASQKAEADETARLAAEKKALDEKYAAIISLADSQFSSGDYQSSKICYSDALALKSTEAYPKSQIQKIDEIMANQKAEADEATRLAAEKKALDEKYESLISQADSQFSSSDYQTSKTSYSDALFLKPAEAAYPKSQIQKIDEILANQRAEADEATRLAAEKKAMDEKYAAIINLADSQFSSGNYRSSKTSYSDALALKSAEVYPKSQIQKIDEILANQQAEADEATRLAAEKKAMDETYAAIINLADSQFSSGDYQSSKSSYSDALDLKSTEVYAKSQIQKIDGILANQQAEADEATRLAAEKKALDDKYASLISQANSQFSIGNYQSSKASYTDALTLKASETYPKAQIEKIDKILTEQKADADAAAKLAADQEALNDQYTSIIKRADAQFSVEEYESSKMAYNEALILKSAEAYPKKQIQKIDEILKRLKVEADENARLASKKQALDEKYAAVIALADSQFSSDDYQSSKISYQDALELKADESYPKSQIRKIEDILSEQRRLAEEQERLAIKKKGLDEKYDAFIALADSQYASETYESAKKNYNSALQVKPDEVYPKSQVQKIDEILSAMRAKADEEARLAAELKAKEKDYKNFIALADKYYEGKRWQSAIQEYEKAQKVKPNEAYPANRIEEIKLILIDLAKLEEEKLTTQYQYKTLLAEADKYLNGEEYALALRKYQEALDIKPKEAYPKNQMKRIEVLLERKEIADRKQKELDEKFAVELEKADKAFKSEQFSVARHHYKAALEIKPKAEYPKEKIAEIAKLVEALKVADQESIAKNPANFESKLSIAREREYTSLIGKGDNSFGSSQFTVAKVMYERALRLFDREYPKKKLKEIKKIIRDGKDSHLTEEYRKLIARGDGELTKNNYSVSKFYYQKALRLGTSEKYPKEQLKKIDELINSKKNAKTDAEYQNLIKEADEAYAKKSWSVARFYYKKAKALKPSEDHPKERLKSIQTNQNKK